MPKYLRIYLVACIALAFGYLVVHAREALRLNVGDPWTDAAVVTSIQHGADAVHLSKDPPVPEILYGAVGKLAGSHEIAVFRLLALVFSGLGAWLLFQYARRMWDDTVALVATALATTSLLWLTFADSIHRPPILFAACFLALWGVVRALETDLRRHYIAVLGGTFVCLFAASNDWLFLPLGVLFTVYVKRGTGTWRVIAVCAAGAVLAVVVRRYFGATPSNWQTTLDSRVAAPFATLARRYTVLFTPMFWATLCWAVWRALRAPTVKAAIEDGTTWMLIAALAFRFLPAPHPESATLRAQLLLPFYAVGSALLIARLFDGRRLGRTFAFAWCALAPLWGLWLTFSHPREVLDREDVARANEYLAAHDGNSFVLSNLLDDGPLVAAFGRHGWTALHDADLTSAHLRMLELFETTGTDTVHAIVFTTPGSRFVDRSITQVLGRQMASVDGWPFLVREKVNALITAYDRQVVRTLEALGAVRVLELGNFDIYRIDRTTMLETAARTLPVVRRIDLDSLTAVKHQLLGWGDAVKPAETGAIVFSSIAGYGRCRNPLVASTKPTPDRCVVVETPKGLDVLDVGGINAAELMVRVERVCDQQLTITLGAPAHVRVAFNDAIVLSCDEPQSGTSSASVRVPRDRVQLGLNIIRLEDMQGEPRTVRAEIESVVVEPICEPPP